MTHHSESETAKPAGSITAKQQFNYELVKAYCEAADKQDKPEMEKVFVRWCQFNAVGSIRKDLTLELLTGAMRDMLAAHERFRANLQQMDDLGAFVYDYNVKTSQMKISE